MKQQNKTKAWRKQEAKPMFNEKGEAQPSNRTIKNYMSQLPKVSAPNSLVQKLMESGGYAIIPAVPSFYDEGDTPQ